MLADSDTVFPDNTVLSQPPSPAADGNADDCDVDAEDDALLSPRSRARALISRDNTAASSNPNVPLPMHIGEEADFNSLLELFYARLFPFREFYRWLCYGQIQKNYFQLRELSFTLSNDAYLRFQSFKDGEDLKRRILELKPVKIDIGAVYNVKPSDKKHVAVFNPLERELVFDIDMTDYDPVRSCCTGADICLKCWDFMTLSIKILDRALQDDFGFKHRLWVYSGRRGVHCWVCDDRARKLSPDARRAIVNYLEIVKGGEEHAKRVSLNAKAMHPSLRKAVEILTPVFTQRIIENQDVLTSPEKWTKVLSMIPDDESKKILSERWSSKTVSPKNKWEELLGITQSLSKKVR
ncbi:primase, DNA, polypeptide 1 (49kDa) [Entophlyctis luteolus]|nr:primase, DNA, polypeptide 1 (49kDa) [Entophlyctis luteolus]